MTDRDIEKKLRKAVDSTAPDGLDRLLSEVERRKGEAKMGKRKLRWPGLVAAILALTLMAGAGGLYYRHNYAVATVVSLDVNPSIELSANRAERVISCAGLNEEGREILSSLGGGEDLKGSKLNVAVYAVVGAIVEAGYLDSLSSAILISVEDNDAQRGARLQAQLVAEADSALKTASNSAGVLSQSMTGDKDLDKQAQENNISSGKAALVNQVIALNPSLDFAALARLSVEELRDLITLGAPAMPIGRSEAARIAREAAGLSDAASLRYDVDPELDESAPHYEVELESGGVEYEYRIHAFTGEIMTSNTNAPNEPIYENPNTSRVLTADEAFNAAAKQFSADYPELSGYNILDIDTEYKALNNIYEVDFNVSGWDFEFWIDAGTGSVVGKSTDYLRPQTDTQDPAHHEDPGTQPGTQSPAQTSDIGEEAAKAAALAKAGITEAASVTWLKCQREYDDGHLEYEIEFVSGSTEYEVTVDAVTGSILKYETETHHGAQPGAGSAEDIGAEKALEIALSHAGVSADAARGIKTERDWDHGRLVYEVEFKSGFYEYEYKIDASTGDVLEHEIDRDD